MPKLFARFRDYWSQVAFFVVGVLVALGAWLLFRDRWHAEASAGIEALQVVAVLVGLSGAVVGLVQAYLQHGVAEATALASEQVSKQLSSLPSSAGTASAEWSVFDAKIKSLQERLDSAVVPISEQERSEITHAVAEELARAAIATKLQELSARVDHAFSRERAAEALERNSVVSLARLNAAIPELTKRANLNLAIGIATTVVGISVLAIAAFTLPIPQKPFDAGIYFAHFLPRLSLAVLIEVFAYFFLRLYKDNLESAAFLRNEMTAVEAARAALTTVILTGEQQEIARVAEKLLVRNSNSYAGNADTRLDAQQVKAALDLLEKLTSVVSPKAG